jgi:hypothetical protein
MATDTMITRDVKKAVLADVSYHDCRIVDLLAGCYGSRDYMAHSYGITAQAVDYVMRQINEMPEYILSEYGFVVTTQQVIAIMRDAFDVVDAEIEEAWDRLTGR